MKKELRTFLCWGFIPDCINFGGWQIGKLTEDGTVPIKIKAYSAEQVIVKLAHQLKFRIGWGVKALKKAIRRYIHIRLET